MKCEEILDKISEYIDQELDPSLCQEIEKHIEDCEPCVAFVNTLKKTVALFKSSAESQPDVPENVSENLKSFLKENIDESE